MMSPSNKLPSYVSELLAAERAAPRPSVETERRVRARIAATVVASAGATTLAATTAQAAAMAGVAVKTSGLGVLGAKLSVLALGVGMLGTAGIVTYRHRADVAARTAVAARAVAHKPASSRPRHPGGSQVPPEMPPAVAVTADETPLPAGPPVLPAPVAPLARLEHPARPAVARPARPAEPTAVEPERDGTLAGESPLIEGARVRIGQGDAGGALALLAAHARRYARGQLEEEREALWVQALVREGAVGEARVRAAEFERRFPHSIQLATVRAAVSSIR
jgi:hypothetical protein